MSTYRERDYSIQYVGVVDDSFGILTKRVKQKPLDSYSSYDHSISAVIKSKNTDDLSQVVVTDRKLSRPKFMIINKPLLLSHKSTNEITERIMDINYLNEDSFLQREDSIFNSNDSRISPYHDKRIIKSIVMKDNRNELNKSSIINKEEPRSSAVSRIEMHKRNLSVLDASSKELEKGDVNELHYNSFENINEKECGIPNPSKYDEYLVNSYSLPKKLAKCAKLSKPK